MIPSFPPPPAEPIPFSDDIERLKLAISASGVGVWEIQYPENNIFWDNNSRKLYGLLTDRVISFNEMLHYIHPEDLNRVKETIHAALNGVNEGRYDDQYRTIGADDGLLRWVRFTGQLFTGENGHTKRLSGISQDITDVVSNVQKAAEAQSLAQVALEASNAGSFRVLLETDELEYSPAFSIILTGKDQPYLTRSQFVDRLPREDQAHRLETYSKSLNGNKLDYEARTTWDDGTLHWFHVLGTFITPVGSDKPTIFTGTVQDITRKKKEREEAQKQAEITAANELRLLDFVETSHEVITRWDKNLRLLFANKAFENQTGFPISELIGKTSEQMNQPAELARGFMERLQAVIDNRLPLDHYHHFPTPSGRKFYYYRLIPEFDKESSVQSVLAIARDLTDIKASEERFRSLIEEAPVATCLLTGINMVIEVANETMIGFWGKGKQVIGKPLIEALPEITSQPFIKILEEVFTTGKTYEEKAAKAELLVGATLGTYYFDYTYKALRNGEGEVYGILNMAVDVTEQVNALRKLEENERFTTSVFHHSPVAKIVFVGEDLIIRTVNENMLRMLNCDASIIGKPFKEALPVLNIDQLYLKCKDVLITGETFYRLEEPLYIEKQGSAEIGYYNYTYKALSNTAGDLYGVMCTATEVTEQVLTRQKVEEAEINLRSAIELAELGTWSLDISSNMISYSERMQKWFGLKPGEEDKSRIYDALGEDDKCRVAAAFKKAIGKGSDGIFNEVSTILNLTTGERRILHAQGKIVYDSNAHPRQLNGTARDITLEKELQMKLEQEVKQRTEELAAINNKMQGTNEELASTNKELQTTNLQLLRSNEELAQFAYVASHDLQEPLRKIMLFSSMLGAEDSFSAVHQNLINKIEKSSQRMSLLIRDLLDFSKLLKTNKGLLSVNLDEIAAAVINDFELIIQEKKAVIEVGKLPVLEAVSLQMNQLFYNLISNALKFSKSGVPPQIEIKAEPVTFEHAARYISIPFVNAQHYHITVTDNGIGFEKIYSDHIFEVFKRLHGKEFYPGSGIGLALCRRIVLNHNGSLFAESSPGQGSTFHVILPDRQMNVETP